MAFGSVATAVARHSPRASISVLWCSAMGRSQPSRMEAAVSGRPFTQRSRSNCSHCIAPQCGQGTKYRCWSEASNSRSIRLPLDRRGRDHEHLAPVRKGRGPRFRQRDRIAFLVGRGRIGVHLVEEDISRGHRRSPVALLAPVSTRMPRETPSTASNSRHRATGPGSPSRAAPGCRRSADQAAPARSAWPSPLSAALQHRPGA